MALTKIGATLGGSANVLQVTQASHGLTLGYPVKMTSSGYAHATADSAANAEAVGIIIATTTNTLTIALEGRITVNGCVPNVTAGTVLYLQVSAGLLAATEPSSTNQVSKPMAVVTVANSEMIMLQQRGEVVGAGGPSQTVFSALELETNEDTYAPPDLIKYSPGVAKVWAQVPADGGQLSGETTAANSYNVVSITANSTGDRTITVAVDFANTTYAIMSSAADDTYLHMRTGDYAVDDFNFKIYKDGTVIDKLGAVAAFGVQVDP